MLSFSLIFAAAAAFAAAIIDAALYAERLSAFRRQSRRHSAS